MERRINHKVGIKILTDMQLRNVMPTYQNLFQKIEACRKAAHEELCAVEKRHYQYNFMYDNVFSILGQRGTGKTSVVFTLKEDIKLKYAQYDDVVLSLIIPEVIPENCTVLGWILAIVREELQSLEDKISELEKKGKGGYARSDCKYYAWKREEESLLIMFDELSQLFYAGQYNPANEASYYRAIDNSVKQAEDYYKFARKIAELWDAWVVRIQHFHELKYGKAADLCPMIYCLYNGVKTLALRRNL